MQTRMYRLIRRVSKSGDYYAIILPKDLGEKLHRHYVRITIEDLETIG